MTITLVRCPVCSIGLPANTAVCPDCGSDLAVLVHLSNRAIVLRNAGLRHAKEGDFVRASRVLEQAHEADPGNTDIEHLLAKVYFRLTRIEDAERLWRPIVDRNKEHAGAAEGLRLVDQTKTARTATEAARLRGVRWRSFAILAVAVGSALFIGFLAPFALRLQSSDQAAVAGRLDLTQSAPATIAAVPALPAATATVLNPSATPTTASSPTAVPSPTEQPRQPTLAASPTPTLLPRDWRQDVQARLEASEEVRGFGIDVGQERETAILSGTVPSLWIRFRAEQIASNVTGPGRLRNELALSNQYVVASGDTLWDVATKVYGSPGFWPVLASLNRLTEPYIVIPGQVLRLADRL